MNSSKKIKVLVTGSRGMLGSDLMKVLKPTYSVLGIDLEDIDIINWDDLFDFLQKNAPDIIINAAAFTDVEGSEDRKQYAYNVNVLGVENLAAAATLLGIKLLHISSDYIFDGTKTTPYEEEDGPNPLSAYGETKWLGDKALLETFWQNENDNFLIVRTAWLFGRKGSDFVSKIVKKIADGESTVPVVSDQTGSPTYSPDLAITIAKLIEDNITGIINVTNSGEATWFDIAAEIKKRLFPDVDSDIIPVQTEALSFKAKRPAYSVLSSERLSFILGEPLRPWQNALGEYLKEFKQT